MVKYKPLTDAIGEVWRLWMINRKTHDFDNVGTVTVMYKDIQAYVNKTGKCSGVIDHFIQLFIDSHKLDCPPSDIEREVIEYLEEQQ
jgi:hypothetical protein